VLAVPPSPKVQVQVATPTPPVVGAVKLTAVPTSVGFGLAAAVTASLALTITETLLVAVTARVSVAVTLAVNAPAAAYAWVAEHVLDVPPSPKVQLHDTGLTPPVRVSVKLTGTPTSVGFGLVVADTASLALTTSDTAGDVAV
jgi:hypothetical protein